ncbi:MAG: nitrogenase component 1 [Thermoanaerobacteraceae bacterium]|nr:nitrogenase component 1 [Thermoanaerobacteraceae bacterium]
MEIKKIPIEGITYDQIKIEKTPATCAYKERDPELVASENRTVVINPNRTCMPLGAMLATLGIHKTIPLVQGAQGCTTYVRYTFSRVYKEPAVIATSSFHEDAAVFGGRKNLTTAIRNLVIRYKPEIIGVVTTCSSEIMGDDIESFIKAAQKMMVEELGEEKAYGVKIVPIHTPSFAGSHVKGYDNASKAYLQYLATKKTNPNNKVNIIPGIITPGDIREIKHLLKEMGIEGIILFDISDTLDLPLRPPQSIPYYPKGGTKLEEIEDMPNSLATFALCRDSGGSGAEYLKSKFDITSFLGPIPIGVHNTDIFLNRLSELTGKTIPESILDERGWLLDSMADTLHHTMMKKVAIFGDPDVTVGVTRFVCELGMEPIAVLSGTKSPTFTQEIEEIAKEYECSPKIMNGSDLFEFEEYIRTKNIDIILGNSRGVDVSKEMQVPLVRFGFPVYDRFGFQKRPIVGYRGGELLLENIVNSILDYEYPDDRTHQL